MSSQNMGTRLATPDELAGAGHFRHEAMEARRAAKAAHLAAKAVGMAEKALSSKKSRRRRPLHDVVPPELVKGSDLGSAPAQQPPKYRRMAPQRHGRRR